MRNVFPGALLLTAAFLVGLPVGVRAAESYRAAVARVDITPAAALPLAVSDPTALVVAPVAPLRARVLVLRDPTGVLSVLVSFDGAATPAGLREAVCGPIRPRLGIYRVRVAVCATGAAETPLLEGSSFAAGRRLSAKERRDLEAYERRVAHQLVEAIREAVGRLEPVELLRGIEPSLPLLGARRPDGSWLALAFVAAAAADGRTGRPAGVAARLEGALGGATVLPLISPASDGGEDTVERLLAAVRAPLVPIAEPLDAQFRYVPLTYRDAQQGERSFAYPIQVWRFGDELRVVFLAGRPAGYYGELLAARAGEPRPWVIAHANADPGALPAPPAAADSGQRTETPPPRPRLGTWPDDTGETIVREVTSLLDANPARLAARIKPPGPLSPEEARRSFRLADDGLRIELAAAEPEVTDPVAIAFDAGGRLYVAEMRDYPLGPGEGKPPDGRVRLLEDRDGDGRFETSSIFAAEVAYPSGIACAQGGVYVTAETEILFLRDTDGDGVADVRESAYRGFESGNSQHILNSLAWGPDNWLYVNGTSGEIHGPRLASSVTLHRENLRFRPATGALEPVSGYRGGFGITFDAAGAQLVCDNQNHAVQVVLPRRYLLRNAALPLRGTMEVVSAHGADVYPATRPLERFNDPGDVGRFSSACGVHVFGGDRLGERYRGLLFSCEPVSNLVHCDRLVPDGALVRAERVERGRDFLVSTDYWFRPVNCATGPDGALYVADMYREVIEHPEWIPEHIQALFDLRSGMERGRIWRVVAAEADDVPALDLTARSARALVAELGSANAWRAETAQRLLVERGPEQAPVEDLRSAVVRASEPTARLRALWTLEGMQELSGDDILAALEAPFAPLRAAAVRLAERFLAAPASSPGDGVDAAAAEARRLGGALLDLAHDPDPRVRFQVALSLGELPRPPVGDLFLLALRGAADPWQRQAVLTSLTAGASAFFDGLLLLGDHPPPGVEELRRQTLALITNRDRKEELLSALARLLEGVPTRDATSRAAPWRIEALARILDGLGPEALARARAASGDAPGLAAKLERVFGGLAEQAEDATLPAGQRVAAVELLAHASGEDAAATLAGLLDARVPDELQVAALQSLARRAEADGASSAAGIAEVFIDKYAQATPSVRRELLDLLARSEARVRRLLAAIEGGRIDPRAIDLDYRRLLLEHPEPAVRAEAARVLEAVRSEPDRLAALDAMRARLAALEGAADASAGRAHFEKTCASCHRFGELGEAVGPDLAPLAGRDAAALLVDILDPNRAVDPRFLNYVVVTTGGDILNGILVAETVDAVLLRGADGEAHTVPRKSIRALEATGQSLMPDGMEEELSAPALRDLLAFLRQGPPTSFQRN